MKASGGGDLDISYVHSTEIFYLSVTTRASRSLFLLFVAGLILVFDFFKFSRLVYVYRIYSEKNGYIMGDVLVIYFVRVGFGKDGRVC